jgi:hypothetical protein
MAAPRLRFKSASLLSYRPDGKTRERGLMLCKLGRYGGGIPKFKARKKAQNEDLVSEILFFLSHRLTSSEALSRPDGARYQTCEKVLVFRQPGLHLGDIRVFKARKVPGMEELVGTSGYAIIFSVKGGRSAPDMMAGGEVGCLVWGGGSAI